MALVGLRACDAWMMLRIPCDTSRDPWQSEVGCSDVSQWSPGDELSLQKLAEVGLADPSRVAERT